MPAMYPDQNADPASASSYRFETSDAAFRSIVNGGFEPYFRIGDSYNNVRVVTNRSNWAKAAVVVLRRYTDASLWGSNCVRYVEIYSETAPGLFSLTGDGKGIAAANVVRYPQGGGPCVEPIARYDASSGRWNAVPVDLSPSADRVFLFLYGTGLRLAAKTSVAVGGADVPLAFAGAQGEYTGLDQVNIELPRALAGRGTVPIVVTSDAKVANSVQVAIK